MEHSVAYFLCTSGNRIEKIILWWNYLRNDFKTQENILGNYAYSLSLLKILFVLDLEFYPAIFWRNFGLKGSDPPNLAFCLLKLGTNFLWDNVTFSLSLYIYLCCEVIIWSKFGPFGSYYLVQVCFFSKTPIAKKHYKNRGFSPFFGKTNCAQKFWKLLSGPSWRFLRRSQLGPDNNFQLGPDNNFQKCLFLYFFALKNVLKCLFL